MTNVSSRISGAWFEDHEPGDRLFQKIGDLELESGEVIEDLTLAYQTWGSLNSNRDNAILVNHALTGWADVNGWWPSMVGPGLPLDTDKYFKTEFGQGSLFYHQETYNFDSKENNLDEIVDIKINKVSDIPFALALNS